MYSHNDVRRKIDQDSISTISESSLGPLDYGKQELDNDSSWSLLAAWGPSPRQRTHSTSSRNDPEQIDPNDKHSVQSSDCNDPRSARGVAFSSKKPVQLEPLHYTGKLRSLQDGAAREAVSRRNTTPKASRLTDSPGSLLRLQSALHPAPHPLPDLARLTSPSHIEPMTTVIHSMASLSRAGMENARRKTNQDIAFAYRKFVTDSSAIAGIFDGHGPYGHVISSFLKQHLPARIAKELRRRGDAAAVASIRASFLQIQEDLRSIQSINSRLSGSTAVIALLQGRRLVTAWVGDSRAALIHQKSPGLWTSTQLSHDHKPTSAKELSRILSSGGRVERLRDAVGCEVGPHRVWLPGSMVPGLAMSRAFGDLLAHSVGVIAEPEINVTELVHGDEWLVLASDGLWEFVSLHEVASIVGSSLRAEDACRKLVEHAASEWSKANEGIMDDISVVVARLFPPNGDSNS